MPGTSVLFRLKPKPLRFKKGFENLIGDLDVVGIVGPFQLEVLDIHAFLGIEPILVRLVVGEHLGLVEFNLSQKAIHREQCMAHFPFLLVQLDETGEFRGCVERRYTNAILQIHELQLLALLFFKNRRRYAGEQELGTIDIHGELAVHLKFRPCANSLSQPSVGDPVALRRHPLGQRLATNQIFNDRKPQSPLQFVGDFLAIEFLVLALLILKRAIEFNERYIFPVYLGGKRGSHDRWVDAPENECHRDECEDGPRDPPSHTFTYLLQHDSLAPSRNKTTDARTIENLSLINWRSGRDSNPRPPA